MLRPKWAQEAQVYDGRVNYARCGFLSPKRAFFAVFLRVASMAKCSDQAKISESVRFHG